MRFSSLALLIFSVSFSAPVFADDPCRTFAEVKKEDWAVLKKAQSENNPDLLQPLFDQGTHRIARQYSGSAPGLDIYLTALCRKDHDLFVFLMKNTPKDQKGPQAALARNLDDVIVYRRDYRSDFPTLQHLLDQGLSIEAPVAQLGVGIVDETPLLAAISHMNPDHKLVDHLLQRGANIFAKNSQGQTALHKAVALMGLAPALSRVDEDSESYLAMIDAVLAAAGDRRAELLSTTDRYGQTPLMALMWTPDERAFESWKNYYKDGWEKSHQAKALKKLLAAGAKVNEEVVWQLSADRPTRKRTVLSNAVRSLNPLLVKQILQAGAKQEQASKDEEEEIRKSIGYMSGDRLTRAQEVLALLERAREKKSKAEDSEMQTESASQAAR